MTVTLKCQYALRAVFELALARGTGPVKISNIAARQAIPPRFLEIILNELKQAGFVDSRIILNELKQAGFVDSRRGSSGGYLLAQSPRKLAVGDVIRYVEGPIGPVQCVSGDTSDCPLLRDCVFLPMWQRVQDAMSEVYDGTTFADLVDEKRRREQTYVPDYVI
jgi:DNA-binding IscR family transcriptional regulator